MEEDTKNDEKPDFVDLLTNAGFKAVFGDEANQDVVMTIINEFLPEHRQVTEIQYLPTEHQGPVLSLNKEFQFDFMCRDASGVEFIVEAQSYIEEGWFQRCACYASRAYDRQSRKGKGYDIAPVYLIGFMGVLVPHPDPELWQDRYISEYTFREKSTGDLLAETIIIIFVELASFDKALEECETVRDRMLYILKNIGVLKKRPQCLQGKKYERIFQACHIAAFDEEKRRIYEKDMNDEKRLYGMLAAQHKEGRAEGLKEGLEKGREEGREEGMEKGMEKGRAELLKNLLESGLPIEEISRLTKIDIQEIARLTGVNQ